MTPERLLQSAYSERMGLLPKRYEVTLADEVNGRSFREVVWARDEAKATQRAASWIDAKEKIGLYEAPAQVRRLGLLHRPGG
jgi:hypothetical protein